MMLSQGFRTSFRNCGIRKPKKIADSAIFALICEFRKNMVLKFRNSQKRSLNCGIRNFYPLFQKVHFLRNRQFLPLISIFAVSAIFTPYFQMSHFLRIPQFFLFFSDFAICVLVVYDSIFLHNYGFLS